MSESPPPAISVVIPTRDRPARLARLLAALDGQDLPVARYEVIVVDDASTPPVSAAADRLDLRVLRHERPRGPAAARNTGWRAARAATVAFIDDDCVPTPGWLSALTAGAAPGVVLQGAVAPAPGEPGTSPHPLDHTIAVGGATPLCISANIAYPRDLLERLDGFDESFRRASGEDADLGARARRAGAEIRFAGAALVHHDVTRRSLGEHVRHTLSWTDGVRALAEHPELRALLVARVFWKPTHPWLLGAALALAARRRWLAGILLGGYARHYRRLYADRPGELLAALPTHLAIDLAEIATVAAGSLRYRTIML